MKNKKVIIITRDVEGTYFQDCCAFKQFDAQIKENKNYPGEHINTYILQFIEEICTNNKDKNKQEIRWNAINKKNKFLNLKFDSIRCWVWRPNTTRENLRSDSIRCWVPSLRFGKLR